MSFATNDTNYHQYFMYILVSIRVIRGKICKNNKNNPKIKNIFVVMKKNVTLAVNFKTRFLTEGEMKTVPIGTLKKG